jgi:hypothetical protein
MRMHAGRGRRGEESRRARLKGGLHAQHICSMVAMIEYVQCYLVLYVTNSVKHKKSIAQHSSKIDCAHVECRFAIKSPRYQGTPNFRLRASQKGLLRAVRVSDGLGLMLKCAVLLVLRGGGGWCRLLGCL